MKSVTRCIESSGIRIETGRSQESTRARKMMISCLYIKLYKAFSIFNLRKKLIWLLHLNRRPLPPLIKLRKFLQKPSLFKRKEFCINLRVWEESFFPSPSTPSQYTKLNASRNHFLFFLVSSSLLNSFQFFTSGCSPSFTFAMPK